MRIPYLVGAFVAPSLLVACSVLGSDAETQEADHTAGDPTFARYGWLWADETQEEFERNAGETRGGGEYLPVDHPMTERLQFWIDKMDEALRRDHPEALRATPPPRILVLKTSETNAWVTFMPIAWKVPVRLAPTASDGGGGGGDASRGPTDGGADADADAGASAPSQAADPPPANAVLLDRTGTVRSSDTTPFERPHDAEKLGELTRFFNDGFSKCRLTVQEDTLLLGDGCTRSHGVRADRADRLSYYATAKHVTFTTGYLLQLLDEDRVVSTLAHELGHYYRSHSNMPTDVVNYFYSLDAAHAHKPAADPRYIEHTGKAREKLRTRSWFVDWGEENRLMAEQRLGFYTIEQEADEIALELMSKVGVPGGVAIDKVLVILKGVEEEGGESDPDAIGYAECTTLRDKGWKDADGKWVSVPVGDPSNAHHNLCFRAFNMAREIVAHDYRLAERPTPPGEPWSRLIARLGVEVDPPPPARPDAGGQDVDGGSAASDAGRD